MKASAARLSLYTLIALPFLSHPAPAQSNSPSGYIISTFAGAPVPATPVPGTSVALLQPWGVAADSAGNVYISSQGLNSVFKLDTNGLLTRLAGDGVGGGWAPGDLAVGTSLDYPEGVVTDSSGNLYIADGGGPSQVAADGTIAGIYLLPTGFEPQLNRPSSMAVDASGNLYVADEDSGQIVKIPLPAGFATILASYSQPEGLAVDASGNLYVAVPVDSAIRKITPGGVESIFAGNGAWGYSGDGGPAISASLNNPYGVAVDSSGNVYIADTYNYRIRRVSPDGIITTVAGTGTQGYSGDGGAALSAQIGVAYSLAVDSSGNLYVPDNGAGVVRKVSSSGTITTVAGGNMIGDGGPAVFAQLNSPQGVTKDTAGNLYIAEWEGNRVRKVALDGTISTVAGTGVAGFSGDGDPAASAELNLQPGENVAVDASGNLFIADAGNGRIRKVASNGTISTIAGPGTPGNLGDGGPATSAYLSTIAGIALDSSGNLYIADQGLTSAPSAASPRIRKVARDGTISTIAGNGKLGYSGDGGSATSAELDGPSGLAVDASGNLYIADTSNSRVRKVSRDGTITTVAGNGTEGHSGDGGPATSAELTAPYAVAVDASGNIFISEFCYVRRVSGGIITTVAGKQPCSYSGDGGPATSGELQPAGLFVDPNGRIYVADVSSNTVRLLTPAGTQPVLTIGQTFSLTDAQTGAYTLTIGNASGAGPTSGMVNVTDTPPLGLTLANLSGTGWSCSGATCTRGDSLSGGSSYPPVLVKADISPTALSQVTNRVSVSGGGAATGASDYLTSTLPAPVITAVVNGATFQPGFATGTWVTIFGANLSRTTRSWQASDFIDGVGLPVSLDGVSVTIDGRSAYVEYISPSQINLLPPDDMHMGAVAVEVTVAGQRCSFTGQVQQVAPAFFTIGNGYVAALHADYTLVGRPGLLDGVVTQPAKPGETVLLYGTGFGLTNPPVPAGTLVTSPAPLWSPVQIAIGGVQATVAFAGIVESGLYQFNVTVPAVPDGDATVMAQINGVMSQPGVLITVHQ